MSTEKLATKSDLQEMYSRIRPYLGGSADAGFTPIGTIISVMGNSAPANYLACNGQTVNIADYPELANYFLQQFGSKNKFGGNGTTTFGIPDLRGEFLRGSGTNGHTGEGAGNGSTVGTHQAPSLINTIRPYSGSDSSKAKFVAEINAKTTNNYCNQPINTDGSVTTGSKRYAIATAEFTISEYATNGPDRYSVRPTNTSVLYCIATKNIYLNPSNDYSTDEKVVGTWIGGETIYQKTIVDTMPEATTLGTIVSKDISVNANVDKFIDIKIMIKSVDTSNEYYIPLSNHGTVILSSGEFKEVFRTLATNNNSIESRKNKVSIRNGLPGWNGIPVYITIQYTKTTS